jgi:hypothetical protein
MGVFAPLVGMIGTVQAAEALKLLTGVGETLAGRLLMVNAMSMEWTTMRLAHAGLRGLRRGPLSPPNWGRWTIRRWSPPARTVHADTAG